MLKKFRNFVRGSLKAARHCPVCERSVRAFLPLTDCYEKAAKQFGYPHFGKGETINLTEYSCPHCGASDRERLYALFIDQVVTTAQFSCPEKLLHFAPEPALSKHIRLLGKFDYRTADPFMEGVDDRVDITNMMAYRDDEFDCFLCSHVLEHVSDDRRALGELWRILKPGGWGILMAPVMAHLEHTLEDPTANTEGERWRLFGQGDHLRLYAKGDYLLRIRGAGFVVQEFGVEHFGSESFDRCGITRRSILYVASCPHD